MIPFPGKPFLQAKSHRAQTKGAQSAPLPGRVSLHLNTSDSPNCSLKLLEKWQFTQISAGAGESVITRHALTSPDTVSAPGNTHLVSVLTHRATKARSCLYKPNIYESVKAMVRFEDTAELNKCLAWTIMEVSPLKSCAKNRVAHHNSRYSTQTKC